MTIPRRSPVLFLLWCGSHLSVLSQTVTVTVPGFANPWLAGMPAGTQAWAGDSAPEESPILVPNLPLRAGDVLVFGVTGSVSNSGGTPTIRQTATYLD